MKKENYNAKSGTEDLLIKVNRHFHVQDALNICLDNALKFNNIYDKIKLIT